MKKIFHVAIIMIIIGALFISCEQNTGGDDTSGGGGTDDGALYKAGTYTATGDGRNGDLTLEVTFDSEKIIKIEIVTHTETPYYYSLNVPALTDAIVNAQSTTVDTISSATKTSTGIIDAVNDAIAQAKAAL